MNNEKSQPARKLLTLSFLPFAFCLFTCICYAQTLAPGAPGKDAQWSSAGKQAIGTSANKESKIWFTLQGGALTEVYYPDVTVANVHKLEFVVVNPKTKKVETETEDAIHEIKVNSIDRTRNVSPVENIGIYKNFYSPSSLSFTQISKSREKAKNGISKNGLIIGGDDFAWIITKSYVTNPENNSVMLSVEFRTADPNNELYIYYDPSLGNTGMGDTSWTKGNTLLTKDKNIFSAISCRYCKFTETTNGFFGVNDGLTQLKNTGKIEQFYERAENGNVVQVAKITPVFNGRNNKEFKFEIALGFGSDEGTAEKASTESLLIGFNKVKEQYQKGWIDYIKTIPKVEPKYQAQFNMAAMVLKAQEDKTVPGANVASLTIPWGGGANANEDVGGGYHLVWSRDLYQVVTAYMALGDTAAANRALDFLFNIQQKADGSFPQNSWLDGRCGWCSLQMDEVAYPLIMAYQLKRFDRKTYENHVKKAADFIVKTGPRTEQERWEEEAGFSPSTIAAEIAGLVCAADIARRNGDNASADLYLKTADEWQESVEKWTVTKTGKYSKEPYYVRITGNGKPDAGERIELNNGAGFFDEREIVDAGFLELVRLGIKSPDDAIIRNSLKVVDEILRVNTPNGESFYRYNHDGYGEMDDGRRWNWDGKYTGKGRIWALLTGERGQYELAYNSLINSKRPEQDSLMETFSYKLLNQSNSRLDAMANFANDGLMIAEQIWDKPQTPKNIDKQFVPELKFGEGTGSATPLAWSMAQFIRLAVNLKAGRNLDTPDIVYERYVLGKKNNKANVSFNQNPVSFQLAPSETKKFFQTSADETNCDFSISKTISADNLKTKNLKTDKSPVICGENKVLFFYTGDARTAEIVGDFTNWKPKNLAFANKGFGIKTFEMSFAPTARVEYKLIVDGKWITDPLNPNKVDNGVGGENSFFTMPDYKPTEWDKGEEVFLDNIDFRTEIYNGVRLLQIYNPKECVEKNCPVLYLQDGSDYIRRAKAIQIQQNLVKAGKIKPFIMVFLDAKDRMKEYWGSDDYAKFLATEVVPLIDAKYKTIKSRDGRAILGASLGGVTSIHAALKYPEIFGRVGGQSSSFWIDDERVVKELNALDAAKNKFRFYFDVGTLEGADDDRKAVEILRKKGYKVNYQEAETGHNWTSWRDRLADVFVALWTDAKI